MKVYVIRHGESVSNAAGRWTGWLDAPLTDKGIEDAKKAGRFLKDIDFDKVFSSDLSRAMQTAKTALPNYDCEKSKLLREINVGAIQDTLICDFTAEQHAKVFESGYDAFGGESRKEFYARIDKFQSLLQTLDCQNVAVFCHGGWLCGMLSNVMGVYLPRKNLRCDNCTIGIFEYEKDIWKLHSWINL